MSSKTNSVLVWNALNNNIPFSHLLLDWGSDENVLVHRWDPADFHVDYFMWVQHLTVLFCLQELLRCHFEYEGPYASLPCNFHFFPESVYYGKLWKTFLWGWGGNRLIASEKLIKFWLLWLIRYRLKITMKKKHAPLQDSVRYISRCPRSILAPLW